MYYDVAIGVIRLDANHLHDRWWTLDDIGETIGAALDAGVTLEEVLEE